LEQDIKKIKKKSIQTKENILHDQTIIEIVLKITNEIIKAFKNNKILFCGNGGSASDAQHLAAEFASRFYFDRPPLFAEALHVNTSYLAYIVFGHIICELVEKEIFSN
jgi:D-sedoheptulose 7-phosphate isomerase